MAPTARLPPKKDVALALLEQASMYIHLDPRADAVKVPVWFKKQAELVLQVGLNMAVPIPDLHVDEQGLSCTLSFNRSPFLCLIPWPAVFALVGENGQAVVWAEDVPAEVTAQAQARRAPEKPRTHLRSVGEAESAAPAAPATPTKIPEKKPVKASKAAPRPSASGQSRIKRGTSATGKGKVSAKAAPKKAAKLGTDVKSKDAVQPAAAAVPVAASKKSVEHTPGAARPASAASKKRELPPYLRVVK